MGAESEKVARFAERGGVRICFEVVGEGPLVVLLHGPAGERAMWRHAGYVNGLEGFSGLLVDARGHGLTGKPAGETDYSLEEYAADVEAVIEAVGASHVALWGYSNGANVAAVVARHISDRIAALITTGWIADLGTPEERAALLQLLEFSNMSSLNLML
jgi:pimeloyl-ACP methyl ester carboxylesterase